MESDLTYKMEYQERMRNELEDLLETIKEPNNDPRLKRFRADSDLFEMVMKKEKRPKNEAL